MAKRRTTAQRFKENWKLVPARLRQRISRAAKRRSMRLTKYVEDAYPGLWSYLVQYEKLDNDGWDDDSDDYGSEQEYCCEDCDGPRSW